MFEGSTLGAILRSIFGWSRSDLGLRCCAQAYVGACFLGFQVGLGLPIGINTQSSWLKMFRTAFRSFTHILLILALDALGLHRGEFCSSAAAVSIVAPLHMPPQKIQKLPRPPAHYCSACMREYRNGTNNNPRRRSRRTDGLCQLHAPNSTRLDAAPRMRLKSKVSPKKLPK